MSDDEYLEEALDRLAHDQSPRDAATRLNDERQQMLRFAQLIRGRETLDARPEFAAELRDRLALHHRVSRRSALFASISALAAGALAGFAVDKAIEGSGGKRSAPEALIGKNGKWMEVASVSDVPPGSIRAFTAGSVQGFLINHAGEYRAMSRICTHMGCALAFKAREQSFACPCHGAEFDMHGRARYGPHHYKIALPPLPKLEVRVNGKAIEVFGV